MADLVEKIALSHPEMSIRFIQNNQSRLHTSGNHNLKDIIYTILRPGDRRQSAVCVRGRRDR